MIDKISTITNIGFGGLAGWIAAHGGILETWLGLNFLGLMIGSAGFHAVGSYFWQKFDEVMMYGVLIAFLAYIVGVPEYLPFFIVAEYMAIKHHEHLDSFVVVPILLSLNIAGLCKSHGMTAGLIVLAVFGLALAIRQFGERRPEWKDVSHGTWHVVDQIGFLIMFYYFAIA